MNEIIDNDCYAMGDGRILQQIGKFVKHYRMEQNKTQTMLAKDAGISRSTLSLLERGETVTLATFIRILRVLGQLQIVDRFQIHQQLSPIALAQAEKRRRQRVVSPKKKSTRDSDDLNW